MEVLKKNHDSLNKHKIVRDDRKLSDNRRLHDKSDQIIVGKREKRSTWKNNSGELYGDGNRSENKPEFKFTNS